MAYPTLVNGQVTDAITQTNVKNLGEAPAISMAITFEVLAQTTTLTMQNSANTQYNMQIMGGQAAAGMVVLMGAVIANKVM